MPVTNTRYAPRPPLTRVKDWIEKIPPASMNSQTSHPANHFHVAAAPLNGKHSRNEFTKPSSKWFFESNGFVWILQGFRHTTPTIPWNCKSSWWWSFHFGMKIISHICHICILTYLAVILWSCHPVITDSILQSLSALLHPCSGPAEGQIQLVSRCPELNPINWVSG